MIEAEQKYRVLVVDAFLTESQVKGTMGVGVTFACDAGRIDHTIWLTESTADRATKDLETLGFTKSMMDNIENLDRIKDITDGHECEIVTTEETWKGVACVKVKWINALSGNSSASRSVGPGVRDRMHALLTGKAAPLVSRPRQQPLPPTDQPPSGPLTDDDVPF